MLFQLGLILLVLYLGALLAHRVKQSSVPVFILAGLGLQAFVEHSPLIDFMAQLGVMLLLFMIGLEFSPERLRHGGRRLVLAGALDVLINLPVGILVGLAIGLNLLEALILGGAVYISSSAIVARNIIEFRRAANPETEYVLGVLVFEDIFIALYLSVLTGLVHVGGLQAGEVLLVFLKTVGFFGVAVLAAIGLRAWLSRLLAHESIEVFLLLVLALILLLAAMAEWLGLSGAVGAFLTGFILPEREFRERVERVIVPFRDLFAAIFFVSFGLLMDLSHVSHMLLASFLVILVAVWGKLGTGWMIGRLVRLSKNASWRLGVALIPRGEFSIILAGLAPTPSILGVTVITVLVLALLTPLLMKRFH
ncbi:MAG: cation:proton antiporter [Candidatus Bipolaricaulota bacterium]|nr:cation:proton antiporter [Candidatus Bipolaricaulota bacterium]